MRIMVMLLQGQSFHSRILYGWEVIKFRNGMLRTRSLRSARCTNCAYLATPFVGGPEDEARFEVRYSLLLNILTIRFLLRSQAVHEA